MLVDSGFNPAGYGAGRVELAEPLKSVLGTPECPGTFRITLFTVAKRNGATVEPCLPMPADLVARPIGGEPSAIRLEPAPVTASVGCGNTLRHLPVLRHDEPCKPDMGVWLSARGLRAYLEGEPIPEGGLVPQAKLWAYDTRLGIALNGGTRTAETGRIYTAETVAMSADAGFLVGVSGADGLVPQDGLLRFGGDGRGARLQGCSPDLPKTPWKRIEKEKRFRLVITSPAFFPGGWILPGCRAEGGHWIWEMEGFRARLVAASVKRHDVVSGWDLANQRPKPAMRAVPAGSVYWLEGFEGNIGILKEFTKWGLWDPQEETGQGPRRAEGFNGVLMAAWPKH
jgi:CRISPR-associated protein Cmr3